MATIEEAVYSRLTTFAEVSGLVGTRVYPLLIPQDVEDPAIAYQVITSVPTRSHSGFSNLTMTRVQFTCQDEDYAGVKTLAKAVRHAWESFRGIVAGINIQAAFVESELDAGVDVTVRRLDVRIEHDED